MFRNYTSEHLGIIALLLEEEENESKKSRRFWIHNIAKKRKTEGEYFTLFKELVDDESKFHEYFRMETEEFHLLLNKIQTKITKSDDTFRGSITPIQKLAVCLKFLATGDAMNTIAFNYRLGHSTAHSIIIEVCRAIIYTVGPEVMPTPSASHWKKTSDEFWQIWNFPNCIGALDGKDVVIQAPSNSGNMYFNYKKTYSIVLMALVDAKYKFIAVDVGAYGKNSDGGIFADSNLGKRLERNNMSIPTPERLPGTQNLMPLVNIADETFPLKTYLLRPYPGSQINDSNVLKCYVR